MAVRVQGEIEFQMSVYREGKAFVAYSPALELATAGKTHEEAKQRFDEAAKIFFEEVLRKGTLHEVLTDLGWQEVNNVLTPPVLVSQGTAKVLLPA